MIDRDLRRRFFAEELEASARCAARVAGFVAVYWAVGVRDDEMNNRLG